MANTVHRTSGALPVANRPADGRVDDDDASSSETNLDDVLASAEQRFVRNDFKQALHFANQVLVQDIHTNASTRSSSKALRRIPLQTEVPYLEETYKFVLVLEGDVSRADRAAAIMLQSHQGSNSEPEQLRAFMDYYSTHAIPLDLFSIYIQFLIQQHPNTHQNHPVPALELATEALCQIVVVRKHPNNNNDENGIQEATDELVWTLLTRMLPFCPNDVYVRHILTAGESLLSVDGVVAAAASMTTTKQEWRSAPVPSIVDNFFPRVIDSLTDVASEECLKRCREQVLEMNGADSSNDDKNVLQLVERAVDKQLAQEPQIGRQQRQRVDRLNCLETINRKDWYRALSKKLFCLVKERIMEPLFHAEDRLQKRGEVAMTIFSLYVAWKQRRRLLGAAGVVTAMILTPLRELVEAVSFLQ